MACHLPVDCSSCVTVWAWHKPLLAKPYVNSFQRQSLIKAVWEFTSHCWGRAFCAGIAKPRCALHGHKDPLVAGLMGKVDTAWGHLAESTATCDGTALLWTMRLGEKGQKIAGLMKMLRHIFWTSVRGKLQPLFTGRALGIFGHSTLYTLSCKGTGTLGTWIFLQHYHTFDLCSSAQHLDRAHRVGRNSLSSVKLNQCWCKVKVIWPSLQFWCTLHQTL